MCAVEFFILITLLLLFILHKAVTDIAGTQIYFLNALSAP